MIENNEVERVLAEITEQVASVIPKSPSLAPIVRSEPRPDTRTGHSFAWFEGMSIGAQGWESRSFLWAESFTGTDRADWYRGARFGLSCVPVAIRRRRTIIARTNRANGTWRK